MPASDADRASRRRRCERWFVRRGVPHAIAGYSATSDVWTRATPFLVVVFFAEVMLGFGDRFDGWAQFGVILAGLAILLAAAMLVNRLRGRRLLQLPDEVGPLELSAFVLVPALLPLVLGVERSWSFVAVVVLNLVILGLAYIVTSYGLVPMFRWGAGYMGGQLFELARLMARTLPLLLLFATFIFLNAEMWQVASDFTPLLFALVTLALLATALTFMALRVPRELRRIEGFDSWGSVCDRAANTSAPLGPIESAADPRELPVVDKHLRFNVGLLLVMAQLVQTLLVGATIGLVYVGFGMIAVREETVLQWTDLEAIDPLWQFTLGGADIVLSWTHLAVAAFIAAFSALQFAVSLTTDSVYREEFFDDLADEIRDVLAVRIVYLDLLVPPIHPGGPEQPLP